MGDGYKSFKGRSEDETTDFARIFGGSGGNAGLGFSSSGIFSGSSTPSAAKIGVFLAFSQPAFIIDTVNEAQPFLRLVGRDLKITQVNSHYLTFLGLL